MRSRVKLRSNLKNLYLGLSYENIAIGSISDHHSNYVPSKVAIFLFSRFWERPFSSEIWFLTLPLGGATARQGIFLERFDG
jgi:hypothetical protein